MITGASTNGIPPSLADAGRVVKALLRATPMSGLADIPDDLRGFRDPKAPKDLVDIAFKHLPSTHMHHLSQNDRDDALVAAQSVFEVTPEDAIEVLSAGLAGPTELKSVKRDAIRRARLAISQDAEPLFDAIVGDACTRIHRWMLAADGPEFTRVGISRVISQLQDLSNRMAELQARVEPSIQPLEMRVEKYTASIARLLPPDFTGRDTERSQITRFLGGESQWWWWRGDPWCGKTTLMASLAIEPPCPATHPAGVTALPYFISRRDNQSDTRSAFLSRMSMQLAHHAGLYDVPSSNDSFAALEDFHFLLRAAAEACSARDRLLMLIVDGLDEDRCYTERHMASIAASIPARLPPNTYVVLASRRRPSLPLDVPFTNEEGLLHPLRGETIRKRLPLTPRAKALRSDAERDLREVYLHPVPPGRDIIASMAAARAPLSAHDLSDLVQSDQVGIETFLEQNRESRCFIPNSGAQARICYELGHDTLRDLVITLLDPQHRSSEGKDATAWLEISEPALAPWRQLIHKRADYWSSLGWPSQTTPIYFATHYPEMAVERGLLWLTTNITDPHRLAYVAQISKTPFAGISQVEQVREYARQTEPNDLGVLLYLSLVRLDLTARVQNVPRATIAVLAARGLRQRALDQARAAIDPRDVIKGLCMVAQFGAEHVTTEPYDDPLQEGFRRAQSLMDVRLRDESISELFRTTASMGAFEADSVARLISSPWVRDAALASAISVCATRDADGALAALTLFDNPDTRDQSMSVIARGAALSDVASGVRISRSIDHGRHRDRAIADVSVALAAESLEAAIEFTNEIDDIWVKAEALGGIACSAAVAGKGSAALALAYRARTVTPTDSAPVERYLVTLFDIASACETFSSEGMHSLLSVAPGVNSESPCARGVRLAKTVATLRPPHDDRAQAILHYAFELIQRERSVRRRLSATADLLSSLVNWHGAPILLEIVGGVRGWAGSVSLDSKALVGWARLALALLPFEPELAEEMADQALDWSASASGSAATSAIVAEMSKGLAQSDRGLSRELLLKLDDSVERDQCLHELVLHEPDVGEGIELARGIRDADVFESAGIALGVRLGVAGGGVSGVVAEMFSTQKQRDRILSAVASRVAEVSLDNGWSISVQVADIELRGSTQTGIAESVARYDLQRAQALAVTIESRRWAESARGKVAIVGSRHGNWGFAKVLADQIPDAHTRGEAYCELAVRIARDSLVRARAIVNEIEVIEVRDGGWAAISLELALVDVGLAESIASKISNHASMSRARHGIAMRLGEGGDWDAAAACAERIPDRSIRDRASAEIEHAKRLSVTKVSIAANVAMGDAVVADSLVPELVRALPCDSLKIAGRLWLEYVVRKSQLEVEAE